MGDPKKLKKKYSRPNHPWQKSRIDEEKSLTEKYGFKNKKGIWKTRSFLKGIQQQAKNLIASNTKQSEKESILLLRRLNRLGLLAGQSKVEDVLNINLESIMERRLQTIILRKSLARSILQSRQFITHRHISINNTIITAPSYLVSVAEEPLINFVQRSSLASIDHPERLRKDERRDGHTTKKDKKQPIKVVENKPAEATE